MFVCLFLCFFWVSVRKAKERKDKENKQEYKENNDERQRMESDSVGTRAQNDELVRRRKKRQKEREKEREREQVKDYESLWNEMNCIDGIDDDNARFARARERERER